MSPPLYNTQKNLTQNSLFCCYLYPKTHKSSKELYHHLPKTILRGAAVDGVHLSLLEWTPSHREISLCQSQSQILFLSNLSFSLSLSILVSQFWVLSLNLDFSLLILISLSHQSHVRLLPTQTSHFPPIFSI